MPPCLRYACRCRTPHTKAHTQRGTAPHASRPDCRAHMQPIVFADFPVIYTSNGQGPLFVGEQPAAALCPLRSRLGSSRAQP
jgi:hypothetical protein